MKTIMLILFLVISSQASENYSFCQKSPLVVTLKEEIKSVLIESLNYESMVSSNHHTVFVIPNSKKTKDRYVPRVEITTASGKNITLREDNCDKLTVVDLSNGQ